MPFNEIIEKIEETVSRRKAIAKSLSMKIPVFEVIPSELKGLKIAGVDGGFLAKRLHGISFIVRRAVGVVFSYEKSLTASYFPSKSPHPEVIAVPDFLEEHEFNIHAGLLRVEKELQVAIELAEKFSPDMLILDGSVVLYPSNRPKTTSNSFGKYIEITGLFKKLYSLCIEKNILLVGAVEDSRSTKLCTKASENKEERFSTPDTVLLSYILPLNHRTDFFEYSESSNLPILQELGEFSDKIYSFYIKTSKFDRPLRVDFLSQNPEMNIKRIASLILATSSNFKEYAYPSVLIEADARAKLSEKDLLFIQKAITSKLPFVPDLFELRRERRAI